MPKKVLTELDRTKRREFLDALRDAQGNISDACYELGISRQTAYAWIKKWKLRDIVDQFKDLGSYEDDED